MWVKEQLPSLNCFSYGVQSIAIVSDRNHIIQLDWGPQFYCKKCGDEFLSYNDIKICDQMINSVSNDDSDKILLDEYLDLENNYPNII